MRISIDRVVQLHESLAGRIVDPLTRAIIWIRLFLACIPLCKRSSKDDGESIGVVPIQAHVVPLISIDTIREIDLR